MTSLASAPARAQVSGALDRYDPAPAGDAFFWVPSADVTGRVRLEGAATLSYARDPLVVRRTIGSGSLDWVNDQAFLQLQLGVELLARLKLDLAVPVMLTEGGNSGSVAMISVMSPSAAHIGDVRIALRGALVHQHGYLPAVGATFEVWAPTGSAAAFSGAGVARLQPNLQVGAEYDHFVWGASAGARFQAATTAPVTGSQVVGGVGAAARFLGVTLGPELSYGIPLGDLNATTLNGGSNAELLLTARYRWRGLTVGLAGGPGFGRAPGSPVYRLLAGVGGAFDVVPARSPDEDAEGNAKDAAVATSAPAPAKAPVDTDGDGVPDAEDACPTIVGDATPGAYRRGCPPDRDRDGIPDAEDACPDVPGAPSADPTKNGCPPDSDGDGIPDDKDACPHEKGPPNEDPKLNGCPSSVRVEGSQIVILQQVLFDTGRDTIKAESFGLLGEVAAALKQHPEIARVAVDGHTDNRGGDKPNKALSERRALAVVRWLVDHEVDARRVEARGFGQRRPIADNATDAGRAKNRRVEFLIRKRTELGEKGWVDGPLDDAGEPPAAAKKR
jgi:outer membrane protein OmpA-like peptidoglycan-associated protein